MAIFELTWRGDEVLKKMEKAQARGINVVMEAAVRTAKDNHPGWIYRTGKAEGSVRIIQFAKDVFGTIQGVWGSIGPNYVIVLEVLHGSFLRSAAAKEYPKLKAAIKESFAR